MKKIYTIHEFKKKEDKKRGTYWQKHKGTSFCGMLFKLWEMRRSGRVMMEWKAGDK